MKKVFAVIIYIFILLAATAFMAEGVLRLSYHLALTEMQSKANAFHEQLFSRIQEFWINPKGTDPFVPPYDVFQSRDIEDAGRLKMIYEKVKLPPNRTWKTFDFLQPKEFAEKTSYVVHSNSLGFRGLKDYTKVKPAGVYRIVALGTYHTFGHGVNDDETYPAQLEKMLNDTKKKYEVWNCGRHAGTAIDALALLQNEILDETPDLIILDYGFVEPIIVDDNLLPDVLFFPDSSGYHLLNKIGRTLMPLLEQSTLFHKLVQYFGENYKFKRNMGLFATAMEKIISLAHARNIQVIVLKSSFVPYSVRPVLDALAKEDVTIVDMTEEMYHNPEYDSAYHHFDFSRGWTAELKNASLIVMAPEFMFYPFMTDSLQYNALGQQITAEALKTTILKIRARATKGQHGR